MRCRTVATRHYGCGRYDYGHYDHGLGNRLRATMMNYPLTLPHLLDRAAQLFGRVEIVSQTPQKSTLRHTYADVRRRAWALAEALLAAGLERGDRVATLMWNHHAHLEAYFGVPAAGGVIHTLNPRLHPDDLAYIANHAEDRFLIVDDVLLPVLESFAERVDFERILVVPHTGEAVPSGMQSYEAFLEGAAGDFQHLDIAEDEASGLCYTSGTTGRPKGVVYSHRALVLHSFACALADTMGLCQRDVVLPVVPRFHVNAWGLPYTTTLVGCKQVLPGPHLDPVSLLDLFEREGVTLSGGVPTVWLGILRELDAAPQRWKLAPGMRLVVGGAAAPESMFGAFDRHGVLVMHLWGMTELTPLGTASRLKSYMRDLPEAEQLAYRITQGLPSPFVEARAVSEDGEAPWDGKTLGELQVKGPWVADGYFKVAESDRWTDDGWFCTGDVASIDPEGYVKIADRTKDLIKSGGEWISSVDLENALMGHEAVREAAVIAIPHPRWQERPLAVVVLEDGADVAAEELRAFLEARFARWWIPDAFEFVESIPRTATGKFLKSALREQFARRGDA
jgi:fatty-acyl-CoA synthase